MAILVKHADLVALDRTVRTAFLDAYQNAAYKPIWPKIATRQTSTGSGNVYPAAIDAASIREWVEGERVVNGVVLDGARVVNQKWELTYGLRREDLDDDQSGAVAQMLGRLRNGAGKYAKHVDKLIFNVLKNNGTCLDGLSLFSASHKINPKDPASSTFDNDLGSTTLTYANLTTTRSVMMELKTPDGDPVNSDARVLVVPPALEPTARKIAQADVVITGATAASETNVYKGIFDVVVVPQLSAAHGGSDSVWYLVDAMDPEDRPLIYQDREALEIVSFFNPSDPSVFERDEYIWGTRARYTAAAGNPKKIFRCNA